ncbi:Indoleamine 2,3-dioxygenase 2 [Branchiostoma belcheri]|nr:Indoleamine 2,3-dioxygenase 2 [Branchiostoma belcheri]
MESVPILSDFNISEERGFLTEEDPLFILVDDENQRTTRKSPPKFGRAESGPPRPACAGPGTLRSRPWVDLARDTPKLLETQQLRECVHKLPVLDHTRLRGHLEYRLAHLVLSILGQAYVWQDGETGGPDFFL